MSLIGAGKSRTATASLRGNSVKDKDFPETDIAVTLARELGVEVHRVAVGWNFELDTQEIADYVTDFDVENTIVPYVYNTFGEKYVEKLLYDTYKQDFDRYIDSVKETIPGLRTPNFSEYIVAGALRRWCEGSVGNYGSTSIRNAQQSGIIDSSNGSQIRDSILAKAIESYIGNSNGTTSTLYRGIALSDSQISSLKVGSRVEFGKMSSWTEDVRVARSFSGNTYEGKNQRCVLVLQNGSKTSVKIPDLMSYSSGEREHIVSNRQKSTVSRVEEESGITFVYLD